MSISAQQSAQLRDDFRTAMMFFDLPPENRKVAWRSADRSESAAHCYRAIVNSLPRENENG
jgi:hypothetical protein